MTGLSFLICFFITGLQFRRNDVSLNIFCIFLYFKDYKGDAEKHVNDIWELTCLPQIQGLLPLYCDDNLRIIAQEIIDAYKSKIVPSLHLFQKGTVTPVLTL